MTVEDLGGGNLKVTPVYTPENSTITNTYHASKELTLTVTKALAGTTWPEGKTLTLTLGREGNKAPMPTTTTATLTEEGSVTFGPIKYTEADIDQTYNYTISEDGFGTGWTPSGDVTAEVTVTDLGGGELDVAVVYTPKDQKITNTYKASGEATLEITKALAGTTWPEGAVLTFTLDKTGDAPMPKVTEVELTAAGKVSFGPIEYDESDIGATYTYTISEDGFGTGWTPSGDVTAEVTVTDLGGGKLDAAVAYTPKDQTITNTYKASGETTLEITKALAGAKWPEGKTLTLTLTGTGAAPMPKTTTVTLTAAGKAEFGPIDYDESDIGKIYTYTISEDGFGGAWSGSGDITVDVEVTDNGDGTLTVTPTYSPKSQKITNTYKAKGEVTLEVTKVLEGAEWPEGAVLTLTLTGDGDVPVPAVTEITLTEAGTASFGPIRYDELDAGETYTYTIHEDGFGKGWISSGDVTVDVKIEDNGDGTLTVTPTYTPEEQTITNTYTADGKITLEVTKALAGAGWPEGAELTVTLTGADGAPMPETAEVTLTEAGKAKFGPIQYAESDAGRTYTYTIHEDGFGDGWTGSGDVTVEVKVEDNGDGTLTVTPVYTPESRKITNTYEAEGEVTLEITKVLEGADWPEGAVLTFTLTGDGDVPMPAVTTVTLTEAGTASFGPIRYDELDIGETYTYTIHEDGFGKGWASSGDVTAEVKIEDNGDGTLKVTPTYTPEEQTITNTYTADGKITLEVTKALAGAGWPEGAGLTVTLTGDEGAPMPETTEVILTEAGKAKFGPIQYAASDAGRTYTYTIHEDGFGDGWTGSGDVTVEVKVVDNGDGTLTVTPAYTPESRKITNTYEAEGEVTLEVTKALAGTGWPEGETLTLTLTGDGDVPLPAETVVTLTKAGKATFGPIRYDELDIGETYTYTITEDGFGSGWTPSGPVTVKVKIEDNGDGTLTVTPTYSPANGRITNTYTASGKITLEAEKVLANGAEWPEGAVLTVTLAGEGEAPMPVTTEATLTAAGKVTFGPIPYDASDIGQTYTYTIHEDGFGDGWDSTGDITVTVKVTDNGDGTLSVTPTYSPADRKIVNTYAAEGETTLEMTKALAGAEWPEGAELTLTLTGEEGAPMPETAEVTLTEAGKAEFGPIRYDAFDIGKTYTYTITESGFGDGWTGSGDITVTVSVEDNGDGTLTVTPAYSPEDGTITNTYEAEGEATLEVTKALEGAEWPEGTTLTLKLTGEEGAPMPESAEVTLTAAGTAGFGPILYSEADAGQTYTYTISEDGFGDGWTGSGDITVTVSVEDNGDGTLTVTPAYSPEDQTVTNTYKAEGSVELQITKKISGAKWPSGKKLVFTLSGGEDSPMPEKTTVTMKAVGTGTFGAITFDESDIGKTYSYTIEETTEFGGYWVCSGNVTATVEVLDNGDGTLTPKVTYSPENKTITNTYDAPPPPPRDYKFTFYKVWEGGYENDLTWTFYSSDGTVVHKRFSRSEIEKQRKYKYTGYFTYDPEGYYIIENVPEGYSVRYENVGAYAGVTDRLHNGGTMINNKIPKTGDNSNLLLWSVMALSGLAVAGGAAVLTRKKKVRKH